jgi:hypothetical protein
MIGTINSIVTKVVGTVSGPIYAWGTKPVAKKAVAVKAKAVKAKGKKCCKGGNCRRC